LPKVPDPDNGGAAALNGLPKHVVLTTLADPWQDTTVISTDGTVRMGVVFRCYLAERAR
jgi:hypothetical protein